MTTATVADPTNPAASSTGPLLQVRDLTVDFRAEGGRSLAAVRGVDFDLRRGETLAVLGESGSGKSVTAQAVMGLLDPRRTRVGGQVSFDGTDLLTLSAAARRPYRGGRIAMIFQDALAALNPVMTIGAQIAEPLRVSGVSKAEAKKRAIEMLDRVRIPAAAQRYGDYPHQLSGGMRQRVMIAMALVLDPDVLIADEPTTALDVTIQAQILDLLTGLRDESGLALLFITHDLAVSAQLADRIAVMYSGRIVEHGPAADVYASPAHPYTEALLASAPRAADRGGRLQPIPGSPPSLVAPPSGCPFHPRCARAQDVCESDDPALREVGSHRWSACHFAEEVLRDH